MPISRSQLTILTILADGRFHSGTELAEALKISRTAVWKQVNSLSVLGLNHFAVSGKGYCLERPLELLDKSNILENINTHGRSLIGNFDIFDCIASTNGYLAEQAKQNGISGSICLAEQQTAGKGRRGRQWVSPFGSNIYLSILWRFQVSPLAISGLSLIIGIAVIRSLKSEYHKDFQLKWPNDIYFGDKKLGGILVEVSGEAEGPCTAVIGLGLNLYLSAANAEPITQKWTDLSKITGDNQLKRNRLAGVLLEQLLTIIAVFEHNGFTAYVDEWRSYDCLKDKVATLYIGQHSYTGTVQGINDQGLLMMAMPDGSTQAFASGEVSFSGSVG
ncbi:BirA family transcriptional regulator, biotin operon repressor / biotin---[acetyl-CoA-carboxylase] ligase [biofilm metagenome]